MLTLGTVNKNEWGATGQTLQIYGESLFRRPKKRFWKEINPFSPQFYHKRIKIMFIRGKCKFMSKLPQTMIYNIPINSLKSPTRTKHRHAQHASYFLYWVGWDETVCVLNVFIFVTKKSITFKKRKYHRKTKKKANLSEQTQIIYGNTLFGLVTQRPPLPFKRECAAVPPTERKSKLFVYS